MATGASGVPDRPSNPEGKITRILVKVGDWVERDQDLFEISTDKVDTAIPSAVAGRVKAILYQVGDIVPLKPDVVVVLVDGYAPRP